MEGPSQISRLRIWDNKYILYKLWGRREREIPDHGNCGRCYNSQGCRVTLASHSCGERTNMFIRSVILGNVLHEAVKYEYLMNEAACYYRVEQLGGLRWRRYSAGNEPTLCDRKVLRNGEVDLKNIGAQASFEAEGWWNHHTNTCKKKIWELKTVIQYLWRAERTELYPSKQMFYEL